MGLHAVKTFCLVPTTREVLSSYVKLLFGAGRSLAPRALLGYYYLTLGVATNAKIAAPRKREEGKAETERRRTN